MIFSRYPTIRQRIVMFPAILAITLAILSPLPAQSSEKQDRSVIGKWKITAVLDSSEITSMDEVEAERLIGKIILIGKDKVQFGSRICLPPKFEVTKEETYKYFREQANASAENLGLPNPVTAVHISCTSVYIKNPNRLVVHWDGFFFDAVRTK